MAVFVVYSQDFVKQNGEPKVTSGKQEKYETVFNHYLWRRGEDLFDHETPCPEWYSVHPDLS